jgi:integrase
MTLLRVGHELIFEDGCYHINLEVGQAKTPKPDRFALPEKLTPYMRHYLDGVRPALLDGQQHDALWISQLHTPLSSKGLQMMVFRRSKGRFDISFGPHRFRHAISTTAALRDPANPGLAAGVLNTSAAVIEKHYNRAGQVQAAATYAALMENV